MNREDIIQMAQEIAAQYSKAERFQTWTHDYMMQRLMELVAAAREACAKDLDDASEAAKDVDPQGFVWRAVKECADAIRARGQA